MILLDMVADQSLSASLAKFTFESQFACQTFCESQMKESGDQQPVLPIGAGAGGAAIQGGGQQSQLSQESQKALEKQCNKQCLKKFFKSYMLYNRMMKEP